MAGGFGQLHPVSEGDSSLATGASGLFRQGQLACRPKRNAVSQAAHGSWGEGEGAGDPIGLDCVASTGKGGFKRSRTAGVQRGLFLKGQLAYCPKRNMSREKPGQVHDKQQAAASGAQPAPQAPPARAAAYIPPMDVPKESRYHTIDMKAVRLSPDIDPQRMKTQLSLRAIQAATVKRPSPVWPRLALLFVGGALGTAVWWFARWQTSQVVATPSAQEGRPERPAQGGPGASTVVGSVVSLRPVEISPPALTATAPALDVLEVAPAPPPSPTARAVVPPTPRATPRAARVRPTARKVTVPKPSPPEAKDEPASAQPKLWLE